jgi:serine phosphatase RsbU (regulator of sigma subunit)
MTPDLFAVPGAHRPGAVRSPFSGEDETYRILVIEDDAGDALLVEEMLSDTDLRYTLRWKQTLADALADLRQNAADCVLLDLHLPDASGIPFVGAVQAACPNAAVIVLTGLAESHVGVEAVANGAQDYLLKGQVDPNLLHRAVRYAVHRKQAERAKAELLENRILAQENARLERGLLPSPMFLGPPRVSATTRYLPARERAQLGGDFLDLVQTGDGLVHAIIGDVSGHGPDEAALGACLRIAWRSLTLAGFRGLELLTLMEQMMVAERPRADMFATCSTVTLDLAARSGTVILAGHHEPLLTDPAGTRQVPAGHGMALGILPGRRAWHETVLALPASGALLLYTDGLIEGHTDAGSSRLGAGGLVELIAKAPDADPGALLDHLVTTARRMNADRHADDVAMLHLAWR